MRGIKHIFAIVFCCAFIFSSPVKAIPVFDLMEGPTTFSKIPVVFDQVKSLKDQLMSMQATLKSMGDKIKSISMFAKDLADKIVSAYDEVSGYTEEISERVNLNGDNAKDTGRASRDVGDATEEIVDSSVDQTEDIVDDETPTSDEAPSTSVFAPKSPIMPIVTPAIPDVSPIKPIRPIVTPAIPDVSPTKPIRPIVTPTIPSVSPTKPVAAPVVDEKEQDSPKIVPLLKTIDKVKSKEPVSLELDIQYEEEEEEEEEEEVSIEEENAKIEAVKESIYNALQNCKEIKVQFNDLLDLSISSIQENSDANSKTLDNITLVINRAEKLNETEKNNFINEVKDIKEKELKLTDSLIGIVDGIKISYNTAYKNKIEDGYKNYEKIAIAYIKGDISKKEFQDAGKKMKADAKAIDVEPDKMVIAEVGEKIKEIQDELISLTNKIKQAEEMKENI